MVTLVLTSVKDRTRDRRIVIHTKKTTGHSQLKYEYFEWKIFCLTLLSFIWKLDIKFVSVSFILKKWKYIYWIFSLRSVVGRTAVYCIFFVVICSNEKQKRYISIFRAEAQIIHLCNVIECNAFRSCKKPVLLRLSWRLSATKISFINVGLRLCCILYISIFYSCTFHRIDFHSIAPF